MTAVTDELQPIEDAEKRHDLIWCWAAGEKVGHLYQYLIPGTPVWDDSLPIVIPYCGAEIFIRSSHNPWDYWPKDHQICPNCKTRAYVELAHLF